MENLVTFKTEWSRREDLINNEDFRKLVAEYVQKIGVSAKTWNENKAGILTYIANEVCGHQNKNK
jgi:hypothetical protein